MFAKFDYDGLPHSVREEVRFYLEKGVPMGTFLTNVFSNCFIEACRSADWTNRKLLPEIADWVYNNAPANSWGSYERTLKWCAKGGIEGNNVDHNTDQRQGNER